MTTKNKLLLSLVIFLGLVIVGLLLCFVYFSINPPVKDADWITYRSEKYGFEIRHPADWIVAVDDEFEPKINIYKKSEVEKPPFIHHNNVDQVSIFPKGIGTEGVDGDYATSTVRFVEPISQAMDFLLKDGGKWGTYATFKEHPASWEDFGFVWASVVVSNPETECVSGDQILPIERCDLGERQDGAHIVLTGVIDSETRALEEKILATFKF